MDEPSDAELLERVRNGDERAWTTLVHRHNRRLWAVARAHGIDREQAADVVQTVWLNLMNGVDTIRTPAALRGWLATVTRNEAIRVSKLARRTQPTVDDVFEHMTTATPDHDAGVILTEDRRLVRAAMGAIGDRCRELLSLLFSSDEIAYGEIAELLDMPIGSIGPTRARCLHKLRELATAGGATP
jgi:RNA polymerase sigma factor (sigma-70 family)